MEGWKRTYWAIFVANLVTAIGMQSFLPFFADHLAFLGVTDRQDLATWSGVCYGAAPLSAAIMAPIWGALGDRFGRRLMVLRAMGAIALFVGAMAFVRSPWELLALRVLQGVFSGFIPPSLTLVSIQAPPERQGRIAASLQAALAIGAIVGPLLGAFVRSRFGVVEVYLAVSLAAAASAGLVLALAREDRGDGVDWGTRRSVGRASIRGVLGDSVRDIRDLWSNAPLRAAVFLLFAIQFGLGATNPQIMLFVRDMWTGDPELVPQLTAVLFSVLAGMNLVALPLWGRFGDRLGHSRALVYCSVITGAALVLHAVAPIYAWLLVARLLLGAGTAGAGPCAFGVAAAATSADRRGGAFGVVFSARALAISISAMTGGALSAVVGIPGLFWLGAVLVLGTAMLLRTPARGSVAGE